MLLSLCFVVTTAYARRGMQAEETPLRVPLSRLPANLGGWAGQEAPAFEPKILAILGVDEYVNRYYYYASGNAPVSLYIGYYRSQRQGDAIHSPMNCLPGAGWAPISAGTTEIDVPGTGVITVNRYLIQKGADRQVVLYWYQSQGRVVASEYWSKVFMVYDAVRLNRSDAALIRVISPIMPSEGNDLEADKRVKDFVRTLVPQLATHLPS